MRKKKRKYTRKKKKNLLNKIFLGFCGFLFLLIVVFSALYKFSPNFEIKGMEITGTETLSQDEIKGVAENLFSSSFNVLGKDIIIDNIFLSFKGKVNKLMEKFPAIESISIKKDFSQGIIYLDIKEKKPAIIWCEQEKCSLLNKEASFIRDCDKEKEFIIIQEKESKEYKKQEIINSVFLLNKKLDYYGLKIGECSLFLEKFIVNDLNGCNIIFNLDNDFTWQVEKLDTVLKQEKYLNNLNNFEYIDLRFGNQAIIK